MSRLVPSHRSQSISIPAAEGLQSCTRCVRDVGSVLLILYCSCNTSGSPVLRGDYLFASYRGTRFRRKLLLLSIASMTDAVSKASSHPVDTDDRPGEKRCRVAGDVLVRCKAEA